MDAERWKRVDDLLQAALQVPAERQEEFLRQHCGGDAELLAEVRSLLTSHRKAGSFLEHPAIDLGAALNASPTMSISSEMAPDGGASVGRDRSSQGLGFAPGSMVAGRYRVVSLLGRGGMGEVYGADDLKLGQRVALKFLPADRLESNSWRDQFYAEVRMARQVSHPNVCRVYDVGESGGLLFLSMEFVDGEDLASLLRRIGRLPDDKAVEIAQQLCSGLAAAHRSGVLHRDLKPSNVMIDGKGRARITDFGLAIAASEASQQTGPAGTPGYLAPESFNGGAPSVQSDVYALGLVLYELFTGKRAFDAANLAELHRKQSETNPTPPSNVVKNFDPAVEKAILRCLERDPSQRPRSAMSVAAALPGGDPLAAALAAGETPAPEVVAAAGPQGSLPPLVAWACVAAAVVLIICWSVLLAPQISDWGLTPLDKSPEVLADRAQELARKLGYTDAVDRAYWLDSERDYVQSLAETSRHANPATLRDWKKTWAATRRWPFMVGFWYRQSPTWMKPHLFSDRPTASVAELDPPYETSGMLTLKLDVQGHLVMLRGVPPQVESAAGGRPDPDWSLLFAEAGLDKSRFTTANPKWAPPETCDSRADWEGRSAERPDLLLHITAASYHGIPVYFQVIAPWDKPWRVKEVLSKASASISSVVVLLIYTGYVVVGGYFARRNLRRGRGDARGALRVASFVFLVSSLYSLLTYHFVPDANYLLGQFVSIFVSVFPALCVWIGYMAVEPFARRTWPKLLISWQRLLNGRFRDPLVGRDVLLGGLVGAAFNPIMFISIPLTNLTPSIADTNSGRGFGTAIAAAVMMFAVGMIPSMMLVVLLSAMTGILRRRWLGLVACGVILTAITVPRSASEVALGVMFAASILIVLVRLGLVGMVSFMTVWSALAPVPPLNLTEWYSGLAIVGMIVPLALVIYGFYVSLGGKPMFGNALTEE